MTKYSIPIYQPDLSGNEKRYVVECLDSTWISSKGRFIDEFERQFAGWLGAQHAVGVCNGTVALHLALVSLGLGPGDEVIVPTLTYIASVNAIAYTGAKPVFVDSLADTWQMDPADVRRKITARTKAVMAVHLYGHPCDMEALSAITREHKLFLIEDCAEAFGSRYQGRLMGGFGDIAAFSFYGNKTITTGEGGMVVTDQKTLYERAKHFKGQGLAAGREYWHDVIGYNYRMTNICAAIGLAQLERAGEILSRKHALAESYGKELAGLPVEIHRESGPINHSYWMISLLVKNTADRDALRAHLARAGIETRPLFHPVHTMPMYAAGQSARPVAEDLAARGINLPSWPGLSGAQVQQIAAAIGSYFKTPAGVCEALGARHAGALACFFERLQGQGVEAFFHPHPLTAAEAARRAAYQGRDFYGVLVVGEEIAGYGMLRGWDEGREIPSLGIVIDTAWQSRGCGRRMMDYLHQTARERGARRVRLKVHPENTRALAWYRKLGYVFADKEAGQWVGLLELTGAGGGKKA